MAAGNHTTLATPKFDKPAKLLIVVSPYYSDIAAGLLAGAKAEIEAAGAWILIFQKIKALVPSSCKKKEANWVL